MKVNEYLKLLIKSATFDRKSMVIFPTVKLISVLLFMIICMNIVAHMNDRPNEKIVLEEKQMINKENFNTLDLTFTNQLESEELSKKSVMKETKDVQSKVESLKDQSQIADLQNNIKDEETEVEQLQLEELQNDQPQIEVSQTQPSFPYRKELPIPYEHQEYLYSLCEDYGLEYDKVLAVMEHESKFDPNAIGATSDFGYFQINAINHDWLSQTLGTPNDPLDPYVNMQWGTYMLSKLTNSWEYHGLTGVALEEAVLSSYNKGVSGYKKTGKATKYIEKVRKSYELIQNGYM
nr:transglycosylase SLT domain-containing protein [Lysinibacillus timonensis]